MLLPLMLAAAMDGESLAWASRPSGADIAQVYPKAALRDLLSGQVVFNCVTDERGYIVNCVVESETPEGGGFKEAALALTKRFRFEMVVGDGAPMAGRPIHLPIRFMPPSTLVGAVTVRSPNTSGGRVVLNCRKDVASHLEDCLVREDVSKDGALGAAALQLVESANAALPPPTAARRTFTRIDLPIVFVAR